MFDTWSDKLGFLQSLKDLVAEFDQFWAEIFSD